MCPHYKIRNFFSIPQLANNIVISHNEQLNRDKKMGWNGCYIYVEHGLGPMKYYTYKYPFFHSADLLFYPGEVFKSLAILLRALSIIVLDCLP